MIACPGEETGTDLRTAAGWLFEANALFVGTGAGMGADCGLGTFRGRNAGVWPPLKRMGLDYAEICNPRWFETSPALAWAFWSYCRNTYKEARPHQGYHILRRWAQGMTHGAFCYTTNVDGHWMCADWPEECLVERHGSTADLQCTLPCSKEVWPLEVNIPFCPGMDDVVVDAEIPLCPHCGLLARPNVLMFQDAAFVRDGRSTAQWRNYQQWLRRLRDRRRRQKDIRLAIIEIGAGVTVPTVRNETARLLREFGAKLIRINLDDYTMPEMKERSVVLPCSALQALYQLDGLLHEKRGRGRVPAVPAGLRWPDCKVSSLPKRASPFQTPNLVAQVELRNISGKRRVYPSRPASNSRRKSEKSKKSLKEMRDSTEEKCDGVEAKLGMDELKSESAEENTVGMDGSERTDALAEKLEDPNQPSGPTTVTLLLAEATSACPEYFKDTIPVTLVENEVEGCSEDAFFSANGERLTSEVGSDAPMPARSPSVISCTDNASRPFSAKAEEQVRPSTEPTPPCEKLPDLQVDEGLEEVSTKDVFEEDVHSPSLAGMPISEMVEVPTTALSAHQITHTTQAAKNQGSPPSTEGISKEERDVTTGSAGADPIQKSLQARRLRRSCESIHDYDDVSKRRRTSSEQLQSVDVEVEHERDDGVLSAVDAHEKCSQTSAMTVSCAPRSPVHAVQVATILMSPGLQDTAETNGMCSSNIMPNINSTSNPSTTRSVSGEAFRPCLKLPDINPKAHWHEARAAIKCVAGDDSLSSMLQGPHRFTTSCCRSCGVFEIDHRQPCHDGKEHLWEPVCECCRRPKSKLRGEGGCSGSLSERPAPIGFDSQVHKIFTTLCEGLWSVA